MGLAMDNYFTLPKVIKALRDKSIGVVGTARFKQSWPPKELKSIDAKNVEFNDFLYTFDKYGTLVARWMDNTLVFLVSTIHRVESIIERVRRRPRFTQMNRGHVDNIWGERGKKNIYIPSLVDDYNHWMGGVDLADQRIAYYMPDLRCRRNWIPIFIQLLGMIRNNSYVVYKEHHKTKAKSHKHFLYTMVTELLLKAHYHCNMNRKRGGNRETVKRKREAQAIQQMNKRTTKSANPMNTQLRACDFPQRFNTQLRHRRVRSTSGQARGACIMCSTLFHESTRIAKQSGRTCNLIWEDFVQRPYSVCEGCTTKHLKCFLCKKHETSFHTPPQTHTSFES